MSLKFSYFSIVLQLCILSSYMLCSHVFIARYLLWWGFVGYVLLILIPLNHDLRTSLETCCGISSLKFSVTSTVFIYFSDCTVYCILVEVTGV